MLCEHVSDSSKRKPYKLFPHQSAYIVLKTHKAAAATTSSAKRGKINSGRRAASCKDGHLTRKKVEM